MNEFPTATATKFEARDHANNEQHHVVHAVGRGWVCEQCDHDFDVTVARWAETGLRSARASRLTGSVTAHSAGYSAGQRADVGGSRLSGQKGLGR